MKFRRIAGVILRHIFVFRRNMDKWVDVFYWPSMDLILWGITTIFVRSIDENFSNFVIMIISAVIFWQVTWRGQTEISVGILEELWNKNLINFFVSPLRVSEWVVSLLILSMGKLIFSIGFVSVLAFILFKFEILSFGFYLIPFVILLLMSGWWIGVLVGSLVLRFGTRLQNLAWSLPWAFTPFSAIFYPLSILPGWVQKVSLFFPMSYIFEGMREFILTGNLSYEKLYISFILNIIYGVLALLLLYRNFNKVLKKGLVKIY